VIEGEEVEVCWRKECGRCREERAGDGRREGGKLKREALGARALATTADPQANVLALRPPKR
jgi:hypothetical protein